MLMDAHRRFLSKFFCCIVLLSRIALQRCTCSDRTAMGLSQMLPSSLYNPAPSTYASLLASASSTRSDEAMVSVHQSTLAQKFRMGGGNLMLAAPAEKRKIKLYSNEFYGVCAIGGVLSCGLTHTAVTPLDVVKCNMQIDPKKYKSIASGFSLTAKEAGIGGLVKGWVPTLVGYSVQGAGKFGLYEFFKQ